MFVLVLLILKICLRIHFKLQANPIVINNNLLIISYPIIFLSNYLNLDNLMASMGQMNHYNSSI